MTPLLLAPLDEPKYISLSDPSLEETRPEYYLLLSGRADSGVTWREVVKVPASYFIWEVESQGCCYRFQRPLEVSFIPTETGFMVSSKEFDVHGHGESRDSALEDFVDFFINDYRNLMSTPDNELSSGARRLLQAYQDILPRANFNSPR